MQDKGQDMKWVYYFIGGRGTYIQSMIIRDETEMNKEDKQSSEGET